MATQEGNRTADPSVVPRVSGERDSGRLAADQMRVIGALLPPGREMLPALP